MCIRDRPCWRESWWIEMEHGQTLAQAARSGATLTGEFVVDCHMHNALSLIHIY